MTYLIIGAVALVLLVVIAFALPRRVHGRTSVEIAAPPDRVWALVDDVASHPAWRPSVELVEEEADGVWRVSRSEGVAMRAERTEHRPGERIAWLFGEEHDAYRAEWRLTLSGSEQGTRIAAEFWDTVPNPFIRLLATIRGGRNLELRAFLLEAKQHLEAASQ